MNSGIDHFTFSENLFLNKTITNILISIQSFKKKYLHVIVNKQPR